VCQYAPPKPPENVSVNIVYPDAIITWDAVMQNIDNSPITPDGYLVLFSENPGTNDDNYFFLGFTTDLTYTHRYVAQYSSNMFYKVEATLNLSGKQIGYLKKISKQPNKITHLTLKELLKNLRSSK